MKNDDVVIRRADYEDLTEFWGGSSPYVLHAWMLECDGYEFGVAGIRVTKGDLIGFCEFKPPSRAPDITVWRVAKRLLKLMTELKLSFIVISDPLINGNSAFLQRLGFEYEAQSHLGEVYKWSAK